MGAFEPVLYFAVGAIVLALDQFTKWTVVHFLPPFQSHTLVPGLVSLTRVHNYGAAFGLLPYRTDIFYVTTTLLFAAIFLWRPRIRALGPVAQWGVVFAAAGALGNLVDRVRFGFVVDFIDLAIWPVFNLADVAVVVGVGMLAWNLIQKERWGGGYCGRDF